jgi:hypothetical protein
MLDFTGETAPEIEFSLPAYANEAQRIANEEQRIADEQTRIDNEAQRIQNEETRINQEQTRKDNEAQRIINEQQRQEAEQQRAETFAGYEQRIETVEGKVTTMESTKMDCLTEEEFSEIFN